MRSLLSLALVLICLGLMAGMCFPARRVVLMEQATNVGCGCAGVLDRGADSLFTFYGHKEVLCIRYNGGWPADYDPFHAHNPVEIDARVDYYSMTKMPTVVIDGGPIPYLCEAYMLPGRFEDRLATPSPLRIEVTDSLGVDSLFVNVAVIAEEPPQAGSLVLRVAVVEDSLFYEAPNSKNIHNCTFRKMLPGTDGAALTIAQGETLDFAFSMALDAEWDSGMISAIAFVQDDSDKAVLQAASSIPPAPAWAGFYGNPRGDMVLSGYPVSFPVTLVNLGASRDTFDIDFAVQTPGDWNAYYEVAGAEMAGNAVALDCDSSCTLTVTFECGWEGGTGEAAAAVTSRKDPGMARSLDFFAVSGVCGLVVDDDGGDTLEHFYEEALDSTGVSYGTWSRRLAPLDSADLDLAEFVVWFTGLSAPTLDDSDRAALAPYLSSGGNLFISGQDIGFSMCDPTSSHYSAGAEYFYETYLHAIYDMPNSGLFDLTGRAGDAISDGLSLTIRGGDGADNQVYPDVIEAVSPAEIIFDYSDPVKHGGLRFDDGIARLVYLSFGFEAIDNISDRVLLMSNIVDWLAPSASVPRRGSGTITVSCYPNPAVSYARVSVGGADGWESLRIYDVRGRVVRDAGPGPAPDFLWDLNDGGGEPAAPGIYFLALETRDGAAGGKLLIIR